MPGSAIETPQVAGLGPLTATSLQTWSSPAAIRRQFKMGGASGYISGRFAATSQISSKEATEECSS